MSDHVILIGDGAPALYYGGIRWSRTFGGWVPELSLGFDFEGLRDPVVLLPGEAAKRFAEQLRGRLVPADAVVRGDIAVGTEQWLHDVREARRLMRLEGAA